MKIQREHIDTPNKLRIAGESPKTNRLFNVTPGLEYELSYTQSENASVNLSIEESDNGTSWQNVVSNASSNGTQTVSFTPNASFLRVSFESTNSFQLHEISLSGELFDTLIVMETFGGTGYRYGYNTQERVPEIQKDHYTAEFWEYDPRVVHRWNRDPMFFKYPWQSPYVINNNNPLFYTDPFGLEGEEPQDGDTDENGGGEVFVGDDGVEYSTTHAGGEVYGKMRENSMTITLTKEYEEPSFFTRLVNRLKSFQNKIKGNAKWSFGVVLITHDGIQRGSYEDVSKAEKDAWTITIYWDDIEDAVTALKRLEKELPKEFRNSPGYSGPDSFIEEAKKYIGPAQGGRTMSKQMEGKNRPMIKKQDEKIIIQDPGGSYMYDNGKWYRRIAPPSDSMYVPIEKLGQKVPDYIINQLEN